METHLSIFVHAIGESASDLGFSFEEADLDRGDGEILMSMSEEFEGSQASWATADDSNLHRSSIVANDDRQCAKRAS